MLLACQISKPIPSLYTHLTKLAIFCTVFASIFGNIVYHKLTTTENAQLATQGQPEDYQMKCITEADTVTCTKFKAGPNETRANRSTANGTKYIDVVHVDGEGAHLVLTAVA